MILYIFFLTLSKIFLCSGDECPEGFQEMGGVGCYLIGATTKWIDSQTTCESKGASLFIMKDSMQWDIIKVAGPADQLTQIWVGLHYDKAKDAWQWSDSSVYDPKKDWAPWGTDQPKLSTGQCVKMSIDTNLKTIAWVMTSCDKTMMTICFKVLPTTPYTGTPFTMPSFPAVSCPTGLFAFAGQCMKYSKEQISYQEAVKNCANTSSYVLFTRDPTYWTMVTTYMGSQLQNFWIGLSYNKTFNRYQWSDGLPHDPAKDWAPWGPNQPDRKGGDCVNVQQFYDTGKYGWIMADCDQGLVGICLLEVWKPTIAPTSTVTISSSTITTTLTTTLPTTTTTPKPTSTSTPTSTLTSTLTPTSSTPTSKPLTISSTAASSVPTSGFVQSSFAIASVLSTAGIASISTSTIAAGSSTLSSAATIAVVSSQPSSSSSIAISSVSTATTGSTAPTADSSCSPANATAKISVDLIAKYCYSSLVPSLGTVSSSPSTITGTASPSSSSQSPTTSALGSSLSTASASQPTSYSSTDSSSSANFSVTVPFNSTASPPTTSAASAVSNSSSTTPCISSVTPCANSSQLNTDTNPISVIATGTTIINLTSQNVTFPTAATLSVSLASGNSTALVTVSANVSILRNVSKGTNTNVDQTQWPWYIPLAIGAGAFLIFCIIAAICACICKPPPPKIGIYPYYP